MNNILKLGALAAASTLVLAGCAANEAAVEETTSAATTDTTETVVELTGTLNGSGASSLPVIQTFLICESSR
jgi:outer membrane murein-binding lipoprotein Lpp